MIMNIIYRLVIILPFYSLITCFVFFCSYNPSFSQSLELPFIPDRPTTENLRKTILKNVENNIKNKKIKNIYLDNSGKKVSTANIVSRIRVLLNERK